MSIQAQSTSQEEALIELRRRRGLTADGRYQLAYAAFNRLVMQSGIMIPANRVIFMMVLAGMGAGAVTFMALKSIAFAVLAGVVVGVVVPVLILNVMRLSRLKKFEAQLPEAIDVIVRSLKAGHPLSVAIAMVAREMPDPVGTEFGIASDEMTYGLGLDMALANMRVRGGQSDLAFLVVAISIQQTTGGNLSEILANLSSMMRARARMKRKVHSLSAEGRFSAMALSIIPAALFFIITLQVPNYYEDVKTDPYFMPTVYFGLALWAIGVWMMRRMVNFKV
jgi:tight adherence protein B